MKKKDTVILLPALMCDERLYSHQIAELEGDFKVIIPVIKHTKNIAEAALHVLEIADDEEIDSFYLAGVSMGGYIAMEIMKINPHIVKKLCLINTNWDEDSPEQKQKRLQIINETKLIKPENFIGINDAVMSNYLYNLDIHNTTLVKNMVKDLGKDTLINQQELILSRKSSTNNLKNYTIPTLIVSGKYDLITPTSTHEQMAKAIKNSCLIVLDNCKHLSPIDQSVAVSALLKLWFSMPNYSVI